MMHDVTMKTAMERRYDGMGIIFFSNNLITQIPILHLFQRAIYAIYAGLENQLLLQKTL